jgi:hypothetical protein
MEKLILFVTALFLSTIVFAQQTPETKNNRGSFEFGYSSLAAFGQYSGNIPKETFHTTSFFQRDFPFIQPDEPDNFAYVRYKLAKKTPSKFSLALGIEYLHTKPNRFDEKAGKLSGLYLANGYTQLGLGVGVYFNYSKDIVFNSTFSTGPMLSNPNWRNNEYIPYKVITPFLPNKFQLTGWGITNSTGLDVLIGKRFAITATFILHYDKSRELRAKDGAKGSFHSLIHSFGIGSKIRL